MKIAMTRVRFVFLALLGFAGTASAQSAADMQRCRALNDAAARLACYDAIPLGAVSAPAAPAGTPARAVTTAPVAPPPQTPAQFGMEQKTQPAKLDAIESSVVGRVDGWGPGTRFELANGQVWVVSDDSSAFANLNNPKARISRGMFGSFFLEMEGTNRAPKVKRIK